MVSVLFTLVSIVSTLFVLLRDSASLPAELSVICLRGVLSLSRDFDLERLLSFCFFGDPSSLSGDRVLCFVLVSVLGYNHSHFHVKYPIDRSTCCMLVLVVNLVVVVSV